MRERASQAVEFPDHQRIARSTLGQGCGQSGPIHRGATDDVAKMALASRRLERVRLEIERLVGR